MKTEKIKETKNGAETAEERHARLDNHDYEYDRKHKLGIWSKEFESIWAEYYGSEK